MHFRGLGLILLLLSTDGEIPLSISYIGLGSNLGNPKKQIADACKTLNTVASTSILALSSLYQSTPLGTVEQADFINAVAKISTRLSPSALLASLQAIEQNQKRVRKIHWGPRTIDLDILLFDNLVINEPDLVIPHPQITQRNFVLVPLGEIEPKLQLPSGELLSTLLTGCGMNGLQKIHTQSEDIPSFDKS